MSAGSLHGSKPAFRNCPICSLAVQFQWTGDRGISGDARQLVAQAFVPDSDSAQLDKVSFIHSFSTTLEGRRWQESTWKLVNSTNSCKAAFGENLTRAIWSGADDPENSLL